MFNGVDVGRIRKLLAERTLIDMYPNNVLDVAELVRQCSEEELSDIVRLVKAGTSIEQISSVTNNNSWLSTCKLPKLKNKSLGTIGDCWPK